MPPLTVRLARPDELREALRLSMVSPHLRPHDLAVQIETMLLQIAPLSPGRLRQWIVCDASRLVSACTSIASPDGAAFLLIPGNLLASCGPVVADELLAGICGALAGLEIRWLHCLFDAGDKAAATALLHPHGFTPLARLHYLALSPLHECPFRPAMADEDRCWVTYDATTRAQFVEVIRRSYERTLDCPSLTTLRTPEDALEGHKATGRFSPHRWCVLHAGGSPLGCLLLNELPAQTAMEIAYMGLVPEARGKGWSRVLLNQAVHLARHDGFDALVLAVDENNAPALRLYQRAGFRRLFQRDAWIRVLFRPSET